MGSPQDARIALLAVFVCSASRLPELPDVGRGVSAVLDAPVPTGPRVEAVETYPYFDPGAGMPGVPPTRHVYVEVVLDEFVDDRLDHLLEFALNANVRCGGRMVPDVPALAYFVSACVERGLAFKATAGLHHAVRRDGQHGFLNLLAAVVFREESALEESDPTAFKLDPNGFHWRDRRAEPDELARVRRERFHSIGSCSFFEPVDELEALGVLPL